MPRFSAFALVALTALAAGCGPKLVVEEVHRGEEVVVSLRRTEDGGKPVARGHAHPLTISDVRLAHILASLAHADSKRRSVPSIRSRHVYELAEGLSAALAKAGPDDEAIAALQFGVRRLGLLSEKRVTSLRAFAEGDFLLIEFYHLEANLDREVQEARDRAYRIPTAAPKIGARFRLVPGHGQTLRGARSVQIDWRDPRFGKPVSMRLRGGELRRRTVLLEDEGAPAPGPEPETPAEPLDAPPTVDPALRDAQLRALDQLDAGRRSGLVTEAEFQRRRRLILEGRLEEAGYGPQAP